MVLYDGLAIAAGPQITRDTLYTVQSGDKYYFSLKSDYYYKRTLSNVLLAHAFQTTAMT